MKKKLFHFAYLPLFASLLLFSACGNSNSDRSSSSDSTESIKEPEKDVNADFKPGDYFICEDGNFKIKFPGEPDKSKEIVPTEVGKVELFSYTYEISATEIVMISYADYPSSAIEGQDAYELLNNTKDGAMGDLTTVMDLSKEIEVEGYPAVYAKGNGQYFVIYQCMLIKNRLFQLMIARDGSYPSEEVEKEFIGSFKLLED